MAATAIYIPPQPTPTLFFRTLTSFELPNDREEDQRFWSAFRASGIKLMAIKVERPSDQLIDYLLSYRGLQAFHLGGRASDIVEQGRDGSLDDLSVRLLQSPLFEHRMSLRDLRFLTESNPSLAVHSTVYRTSTELLRALHRFRHLKRLDFVHSTGIESALITMLDMLAALSPKLKTVCFTVLRPKPQARSSTSSRRRRREPKPVSPDLHMEEVLRPLQEGYCFKIRPVIWRELRVIFRSLEPHDIVVPNIPFKVYRAVYEVVEEAGKYWLVLDPVGTELLSEEGACFKDEDTILI